MYSLANKVDKVLYIRQHNRFILKLSNTIKHTDKTAVKIDSVYVCD